MILLRTSWCLWILAERLTTIRAGVVHDTMYRIVRYPDLYCTCTLISETIIRGTSFRGTDEAELSNGSHVAE